MSRPKEIIGALYFESKEPHLIGHLSVGGRHDELVGVRRSNVCTEISGRRVAEKPAGSSEEAKEDETQPDKCV
jgi:hypothetical protein